jgi:hypothetical protein
MEPPVAGPFDQRFVLRPNSASFEHLKEITASRELGQQIHQVDMTTWVGKSLRLNIQATEEWTPDKDVLVRTFKNLPYLRWVRVGAASAHIDCRVYDLVLQALFDADKHPSVVICLYFLSLNEDTPPGLSLDSTCWNACSSQVRSVTFSGYTSTKWHKALLGSTQHLKILTLNSCGTLELKELTQHILPGLRSFELDDAFCSGSELREFLNRHQNSMKKVDHNPL